MAPSRDARRRAARRIPGPAAAWAALIISGLFEAVWAHALDAGLVNVPAVVAFVLAMAASMYGLQVAMRAIPMGTAYAVWAGAGTTATAVWSAITGTPFTLAKMFFLVLVVVGIIGLELTTPAACAPTGAGAPGDPGAPTDSDPPE